MNVLEADPATRHIIVTASQLFTFQLTALKTLALPWIIDMWGNNQFDQSSLMGKAINVLEADATILGI